MPKWEKTQPLKSVKYFIPNFSLWRDHESYQEAFQRLLRDLKTN